MTDFSAANFPLVGAPWIDPKGNPTQAFLALIRALWNRTGQGTGLSADDLAVLSLLAQSGNGRADHVARDMAQEAVLLALAVSGRRRAQAASASGGKLLTATEAISAGDLTQAYGSAQVRKADGSDPTKFCNSFSLTGIGSGSTGLIQFAGFNDAVTVASGQAEVWLSDVTPGAFSLTAPTTTGRLLQTVGAAVQGLGLAFAPGVYTIL